MNDFNPTKKDLLLIEQRILDLKLEKAKMVNIKTSLQNKLSYLKSQYANVAFNSSNFKKIKADRQDVKNQINNIEIKIKTLNDELNFKTKLKNEIIFYISNNKVLEGKEDIERIVQKATLLKNKYIAFTKDRTRISSLRIMASEFVSEIDDLIKNI